MSTLLDEMQPMRTVKVAMLNMGFYFESYADELEGRAPEGMKVRRGITTDIILYCLLWNPWEWIFLRNIKTMF